METSVGEKIFTTLLIIVTFGSVAGLVYSLVNAESSSLPAKPGLMQQQSLNHLNQ